MIYYLLLMHFLADFPFQLRWMAENKSHSQFALITHILTYGSVLTAGLYYMMPIGLPLSAFVMFIFFNLIVHYVTDSITSKITSFLWKKNQTYLFFCTIGFDQLIHTCTLIFSCRMFIERLEVGKDWLLG